ncbi:helix-turn-helix domain-containing protein [Sphingobacterium sp. SGR-19]|uniref:helix-turn-helix domain-containing protein n=1 Tax=Sphingobacterium sp. SGR-19 TaxID=2710886 RepID=UPI0013EAA899|nr:AraC family transcriptional regulator [Sphingobacterium sp. SGR-19]NGM65232.1 helix-turn-helix transcriptional regulator [Sphingobacterium sp. SGR-19]
MSEEKLDTLDRRACAYILEHYMEPDLDRHRIAAALGCSTRNLSRAFEGSGVKLHAYIRLLRLHKGRELLHKRPNLTIKQIAERVYFCNAKHFATCYKAFLGFSPSEERKMIRRRK